MIIDKLYEEVLGNGPVCVGLDTRFEYLPEYLINSTKTLEEKIFEFNRKIIDATYDLVACYKVQIACYEAFGIEGLKAYSRTLKYIREKGKVVIADIKRGDILSTAEMYAKAHFEGDFEADFITVNPYMGLDAISPYFKYLNTGEKGIFVLIRTSNKSSKDFQELNVDNKPLYLKVAENVQKWGESFIGKSGFSLIGGVVGLTFPKEFLEIKNMCGNMFFLIPGYGAQGGTGEDLKEIFKEKMCGVVNSSRGIIKAHKGVDEGLKFNELARKQVIKMKEDILRWQE
ncbi:orotidine 5'-phosphate decarboxylase [Caloranaerobacter azorensis H53214]|uniref:Orotidine 5'-phosphate decarboxylase n=1 Tax=Caloranaerobacter azorensis H53214 TaxID=1156417 RepID=A0A096BEY8_9FIRM|nr:orotidine-5'-phosphate decarboxylase [Caloranaerobacter azorensis]KGG79740.1 orotidine 5'-phosphate decarboxylase [Caloranaerobacter azorensis H53214]